MSSSKKQISSDVRIEKILGKPEKLDYKSKSVLGSTSYFLKNFECVSQNWLLKENSKCAFQKYEFGLLLRAFYSNNLEVIPIKFGSIIKVTLIKGKETVNPSWYSPMTWLLKLGLPLRKARHFRLRASEYSIDQMTLIIQGKGYLLEMITGGWLFESQRDFFKPLFPIELFEEVHQNLSPR